MKQIIHDSNYPDVLITEETVIMSTEKAPNLTALIAAISMYPNPALSKGMRSTISNFDIPLNKSQLCHVPGPVAYVKPLALSVAILKKRKRDPLESLISPQPEYRMIKSIPRS